MNKTGHMITSLFFLSIVQTFIISLLLFEFGRVQVFITGIISLITFMVGVGAPDLDHSAVQKNLHIRSLLANITSHRGHFHSIVGVIVYSLIITLITIFILEYWYITSIAGGLGYLSHLIEDQAWKYYKKSNAKNGLKLW